MFRRTRRREYRISHRGFTLVELLVASCVFALMLVFILSVSDDVRHGWERGEHQVEVAQNGRAILNLMERDLTRARVSHVMQLAQNPNIASLLSGGETQLSNSSSLFWWAPYQDAASGLCEVGWYLAQNPAATDPQQRYRLYRLFRPLTLAQSKLTPGTYDLTRGIYWLSSSGIDQATFNDRSSVVFSGALGFWVSCLDRNGNAIPDLATKDILASPMRFNSGARFQMAAKGGTFEDGSTTQYTDSNTQTLAAELLPDSVKIVLLLTDERTLKRHPVIPPIPANTLPADTDAIARYALDLAKAGIPTRIFSTTIKLMNGYEK